jgi:hypothetical protein
MNNPTQYSVARSWKGAMPNARTRL